MDAAHVRHDGKHTKHCLWVRTSVLELQEESTFLCTPWPKTGGAPLCPHMEVLVWLRLRCVTESVALTLRTVCSRLGWMVCVCCISLAQSMILQERPHFCLAETHSWLSSTCLSMSHDVNTMDASWLCHSAKYEHFDDTLHVSAISVGRNGSVSTLASLL